MSQNSNTRGIQSYFQPIARTASDSVPAHIHTSPQACTSSSSSPPASKVAPSLESPSSSLPDRKSSPAPRPVLEIGASDDDEDDDDRSNSSNDSLEDLGALLGRERPVIKPYSTPKAKRTAVTIQESPLPFISKHKFDLKALAKDARQDDATHASSMRSKAVAEAARDTPVSLPQGSLGGVIEDIVKNNDGKDAQKVIRTVQRSDLAKIQAWYCFFDRDYRVPPSSPAPAQSQSSPWQLLTRGNLAAKERNLASGLPQTILTKLGGLPDDFFHWILDELCIQTSSLIRQEYCNIIASCPDQVERLLTPERLKEMFTRLGATDELENMGAELTISKPSHRPYADRDWSCVVSFLALLCEVSRYLSIASAIYTVIILLRMALDKILICNIDMLPMYETAVNRLANVIPQSSWDSFCFDACSLLHSNIKLQFIRVNALQCLSIRDPRSHDLRRRLAATYLFDDPEIGRRHPDEVLTIKRVTNRLRKEDFSISPDTDFSELKAGMLLVDMVIDDGSANVFGGTGEEKAFNRDVDELASRLGEIWRKINDSGMKLARTEAKSVVEWVQQRLLNAVRTRRKTKKSIFDSNGHGDIRGQGQEEDASLPRQQEMMRNFIERSTESK